MLILIVAGGPDKGRIYELLEEQPIVVGREGDQIKLNDRRASRRHARLWAEGGKWYVRDLNSRHGTIVNARPIEGRTELQDGDHLQVGKTLFVLARMPVEQAERMALLGDATGELAATPPLPLSYSLGGRGKLLVAGGALAAALVIGSNAAIYFTSMNHTDALRQEIASAKAAAEASSRALRAEVERVASAPAQPAAPDPMLERILAAVEAQREQEKVLTQIHDAVAQLPTATAAMETIAAKIEEQPQHTELLQGILAKLESRPEVDALLAEVKAMADAARAQQEALAARTVEHDELLKQTLAEVKDAATPSAETFAAAMREAAATIDTDNAELLEQVRANLQNQETLALEVRELSRLVQRQPEATRQAVAEIVSGMPVDDDQAVLAAIAEVRAALPPDAGAKLDEVIARLDRSIGLEQVAAAVKSVVEQQTQTLTAKLDSQLTKEELLAALERATAEPDPQLMARIDALAERLELQAAKPPADAEAAEQLAATQALLRDVLAEVRNREPIEQLRAEVQQLAAAAGEGGDDAVLSEILAAVRDGGDAEARLSEIHDILRAWPAETEAMLKQALAAVQPQADPAADPAVEEVLREVRSKAMARIDAFHAAIRNDLQAELSQAMSGAPGAVSGQAAASGRAAPADAARGRASRVTRSALMSPQTHQSDTVSAVEPDLTQTEQAYKIAFETGQPVTIGAGAVNAVTGEVSEGRTLDPVAARAAGIKHWREWYLMDFFAEKMRLQKKAMRFAGDRGQRQPLITLPPAHTEVNVNAMPQPANEADAAEKP